MKILNLILASILTFPSLAMIINTSFDRGDYIEIFGNKKLTPLWSQEYIGSDLIQDELKDLNLSPVDLAIYDLGFEQDYVTLTEPIDVPYQRNGNRRMRAHHGTSVASVINGPYPFGHTSQINLIQLGSIHYSGMYRYYYNKLEAEGRYPKIISNSLGWNSESILEVVNKADKKGVLWFLASGNRWPEEVRELEIKSKAMLVGSFSPLGLTTFGTQLHNDMLILAPANSELLAIDGLGKRTLFGGTSGATPVVAATMANIASLWPKIDRANTIKLLKNTAFYSAENKIGNLKAPRLLNAYKAFKVAQRILSYCRSEDNVKSCFNQSLDKPSFHLFDLDLITCSEFKKIDRDFKNDLLKKMRRRALLGIRFQDEHLSCAYESIGFDANAEFYRFRSQQDHINFDDYLEDTLDALYQGVFEISYYKYLNKMNKEKIRNSINNSSELSDYHKQTLLEFIHE